MSEPPEARGNYGLRDDDRSEASGECDVMSVASAKSTDQAAPDQAPQDQAFPDQAFPDQAAPDQASPDQASLAQTSADQASLAQASGQAWDGTKTDLEPGDSASEPDVNQLDLFPAEEKNFVFCVDEKALMPPPVPANDVGIQTAAASAAADRDDGANRAMRGPDSADHDDHRRTDRVARRVAADVNASENKDQHRLEASLRWLQSESDALRLPPATPLRPVPGLRQIVPAPDRGIDETLLRVAALSPSLAPDPVPLPALRAGGVMLRGVVKLLSASAVAAVVAYFVAVSTTPGPGPARNAAATGDTPSVTPPRQVAALTIPPPVLPDLAANTTAAPPHQMEPDPTTVPAAREPVLEVNRSAPSPVVDPKSVAGRTGAELLPGSPRAGSDGVASSISGASWTTGPSAPALSAPASSAPASSAPASSAIVPSAIAPSVVAASDAAHPVDASSMAAIPVTPSSVVGPGSATPSPVAPSPVAPSPVAPGPVAQSPATPSPAKAGPPAPNIQVLLERGRQFFETGDVAGARLLFQRAADAGDATAALAMGATYDPVVLARHGVRGLSPDIEKARSWYERAKELGSPEGPRRLEMLANR